MERGKHVKPRPSGAQQRKTKATKKIAVFMLKYVVTNSITRADEGGDDSSASTTNAPTMHQQLRLMMNMEIHHRWQVRNVEDEREREDPIYECGECVDDPTNMDFDIENSGEHMDEITSDTSDQPMGDEIIDTMGPIIWNISSRDEILTHVTELKFQLPCQFNYL